jgi:hypothetical protein
MSEMGYTSFSTNSVGKMCTYLESSQHQNQPNGDIWTPTKAVHVGGFVYNPE